MRFYVYELIDPFSGEPFYVGKGTKNRIACHEADAKRGAGGPKCDRIREIWTLGGEIKRTIVERFADEAAAYEFEGKRIAACIAAGIALTNISMGGRGGWSGLAATAIKLREPFQWTIANIKPHLKTIWRALTCFENGAPIKFGPYDMTSASRDMIARIMKDIGREPLADLLANA